MKIRKALEYSIEHIFTKLVLIIPFFCAYLIIFKKADSKELICFVSTKILSESNTASIITITSVFIGFFATIMTMFASSQTDSLKRLIKTNMVDKFLLYAKSALVSSLFIMVLSLLIFAINDNELFIYFYICLFSYFIFSSLRFTYVCISMLSYSLDAQKKIDSEKEASNAATIILEKENEE